MRTITTDSWILDIEETDDGINVLRAAARGSAAALPDALLGRPLRALSDHAFKSEENRGLKELQLPAGLLSVGDYAFYGCGSLESLHLSDNILSFGGGVFTSCRSLRRFTIRRTSEKQGPALAAILSELSREIDVTLIEADGRTGRLIFPEYEEETREISGGQMVFFAYSIEGAGYTYHHCLKDRVFSYRSYDDLWRDYLGRGYSLDTAIRQALCRLAYPLELQESAAAEYIAFLRKNGSETMRVIASDSSDRAFYSLIPGMKLQDEALSCGAQIARERGNSELLAILLETMHAGGPKGKAKQYDL